jgi:nitrate reductase NapD
MNISAILVVVPPDRLDAAIDALDALPGVDVHHHHPSTGRIVITQEAERIRHEVAGLERIKTLPDVVMAEMVSHYFEDDQEILDGHIPELPEVAVVPAFLNDEPPDPNARNGEE